MGTLADALNFEKAYTIEGVTFTAKRLSISDILRCAIEGLKEAEGIDDERAYEMAEDLIGGDKIVFPKAGIMHVMAASSDGLDLKDAEALVVVDEMKARNVCRFALGLDEIKDDDQPENKEAKPKKKERRLIGSRLIQSCNSIFRNHSDH